MAAASRVKLESKIEYFAIQTRLIILFFQLIFNAVIPDHDADAFNPPVSPGHNPTPFDKAVNFSVGGLRRWDGIYIMHVAEYGYTYENTAAFMPLYPITVGKIADGLYCYTSAGYLLSKLNICMLIGIALNLYFFTKAASTLYLLGVKVLRDEARAYKAALLFCVNPASIFMTAPYTESLFAYLTLNGLLQFAHGQTFWASVWFGISTLSRANGIVSVGFILHRRGKGLMRNMQRLFETKVMSMMERVMIFASLLQLYLLPAAIGVAACFAPFLLYQYYIYRLFCLSMPRELPIQIKEYGERQGYVLPGQNPAPWCSNTIPLSYSYIQSQHWNVGFLRYFEFKQIPNFLLAAPVIALSVCACMFYYRQNKACCHRLGMVEEGGTDKKTDSQKRDSGFSNIQLFVYVAHLLVLTLFGVFCMHIQVMTRFLCASSPVIYWYAARLITHDSWLHTGFLNKYDIFSTESRHQVETPANMQKAGKGNLLIDQISEFRKQDNNTKLVLGYFLIYFVVGSAAFSNFLPWT